MPVTPKGNGFLATVHHQGQRYRQQFATKVEAETWDLQTKAALLRGEPIQLRNGSDSAGVPTTMQQLYELTHRRFWAGKGGEKPAVINATKVLEALGPSISPAAVTTMAIDAMIFQFEDEGLSDSTINRRLSALSKMLTFAVDRGYITKRPKIERKEEVEGRIRYITEDEETKMLAYFDHIGQAFMKDVLMIGVDTGMRIGEMLRVEARDIHNGLLTVWVNKSKKPRSIPLTSRVQAIYDRLIAERPQGKLMGDLTYATVYIYWKHCKKYMRLSDDQQFVIHTMRHTFCSRLVQRGVDIVTVSKLAGHSSITVTMRYAHLAPDNLSNAIKKLETGSKDVNLPVAPLPGSGGVEGHTADLDAVVDTTNP